MASPTSRRLSTIALSLSLLTFGLFFTNVLLGGPLGRKPWMGDVAEMLTLFMAVVFFVAGALAREAEAPPPDGGRPSADGASDAN